MRLVQWKVQELEASGMNRATRALALVVSVLASTWPLQAAPIGDEGLDDYRITHWERTGGSPTELLVALAQDREGFLWLGSGDGLTRFDGFTFERWDDISRARLAGTRLHAADAGIEAGDTLQPAHAQESRTLGDRPR